MVIDKYGEFLVSNAIALDSRWKVFALLVKKKPIAFASNDLRRRLHAEVRCMHQVTEGQARGATLFVVRVTQKGEMAIARPCAWQCEGFLKKYNLKAVYYSTKDGWEKM